MRVGSAVWLKFLGGQALGVCIHLEENGDPARPVHAVAVIAVRYARSAATENVSILRFPSGEWYDLRGRLVTIRALEPAMALEA